MGLLLIALAVSLSFSNRLKFVFDLIHVGICVSRNKGTRLKAGRHARARARAHTHARTHARTHAQSIGTFISNA